MKSSRRSNLRIPALALMTACATTDAPPSDDTAPETDDTEVGDTDPPASTVTLTLDPDAGWGDGALVVDGHPPCDALCEVEVPEGATITVTAVAGPGQAFSEWTAGCEGGEADSCEVVADSARTVGAYFTGGVPLASFPLVPNAPLGQVLMAPAPDGDVVVCASATVAVPVVTGTPGVVYGPSDLIVARIDSEGSLVWVTRSRGGGTEMCRWIVQGSDGDYYLTAYADGELRLGDATLSSTDYDWYTAKVTKDGEVAWVVRPDRTNASFWGAPLGPPLLHPDGSLYVPGADDGQAVLVKMDPSDGSHVIVPIPTLGTSLATRLAVAPEGDLYAYGSVDGWLGSGEAASSGTEEDLFVARMSTSGGIAWGHAIGSDTYGDLPWGALASDGAGNVWVGGAFYDGTRFPGEEGTRDTLGSSDWFFQGFDAFGDPIRLQTGGGPQTDEIVDLAVDEAGSSLYVAGEIMGTGANPSTTQSAPPGYVGAFLARLEAEGGGGLFVRSFLATQSVSVTDLALVDDAVLLSGTFLGTSRFGMPAPAAEVDSGGATFLHVSGR